jgi:ribose transport system substrate-binding protein
MLRYNHARRLARGSLIAGTVTCAALALGACGGSSSSSTTNNAAAKPAASGSTQTNTTASGSTQANAAVAYAQARLAQVSGPVTNFPPPGPPLKNVASLRGKTVYYVPVTLEDPEFAIVAGALKTAFSKVGINLVPCSAQANPSGISACMGRVVAAKAAGVITDSIPFVEAANAFEKVEAAKIPIMLTDQLVPPPGVPGSVKGLGDRKLGYILGNGTVPLGLIADWVIADSGGKANVLISEFVDSPSTIQYVQQGAVPEFQKHCPGCKVAFSKVQNANFNLIPSQTSASLLSNPSTNYVIPEFDAAIQPVYGGVQHSGFASKVKGASTSAILGGLQMIKAKQFMAADVGTNFPYQAWADADNVMRQMLGMPVVAEHIPMRLFTAQNINSIQLTPAAQSSGAWYGTNGYQTMFSKLWGQ